MPRGDGTGPRGEGPGTGRGRRGGGASGIGGLCVCPKCGKKIPHKRAAPCYQMLCPECGTKMIRG